MKNFKPPIFVLLSLALIGSPLIGCKALEVVGLKKKSSPSSSAGGSGEGSGGGSGDTPSPSRPTSPFSKSLATPILKETAVNDPLYPWQYSQHNEAQVYGGKIDGDMNAPRAWEIQTDCREILVAIIDTGLNYQHPDLIDNIWANPNEIPSNGVDDDDNGYVDDIHGWNFSGDNADPMDDHGHGSHTAGVIGASGNNGIGVAGICWNAKIMGLKFISNTGTGYTSDAIEAINYATTMGVKISNNSWGGYGYSSALKEAIDRAEASGSLFVAAAGNDNVNSQTYPHYPSSYTNSNIISVAATDHKDELAYFSNWGSSVDIAAAGVSILSTTLESDTQFMSGTSMASPQVAGAAALVWANDTSLSAGAVKARLLSTGDSLSTLNNKVNTGKRINVHRALTNTNAASEFEIKMAELFTELSSDSDWLSIEIEFTGQELPANNRIEFKWNGETFSETLEFNDFLAIQEFAIPRDSHFTEKEGLEIIFYSGSKQEVHYLE
jgi:subtilisin family serine protease